jgi:hypothetical protein
MLRRFVSGLLISVLLSITAQARAWDDFGHMEVAAVAYASLQPRTKRVVAALLALNPSYSNWIVGAAPADVDRVAFMRAATWPDAIKFDPAYEDSDPRNVGTALQNIGYADHLRHDYWHYIDQTFTTDGTPATPAVTASALTQIVAFCVALENATLAPEILSYDLVWLLHLVGDLHQPLHCGSRASAQVPRGDRGGNAVQIRGNTPPSICEDPRYCPYGPPTNLHAFVDTIAGSAYGVAPVLAAARRLPKASAKDAAVLDPRRWIEEGLALAKSHIYVAPVEAGTGPFLVDARYQAAILELGRARIALAGARLAKLLNTLLAHAPDRRGLNQARPAVHAARP